MSQRTYIAVPEGLRDGYRPRLLDPVPHGPCVPVPHTPPAKPRLRPSTPDPASNVARTAASVPAATDPVHPPSTTEAPSQAPPPPPPPPHFVPSAAPASPLHDKCPRRVELIVKLGIPHSFCCLRSQFARCPRFTFPTRARLGGVPAVEVAPLLIPFSVRNDFVWTEGISPSTVHPHHKPPQHNPPMPPHHAPPQLDLGKQASPAS